MIITPVISEFIVKILALKFFRFYQYIAQVNKNDDCCDE